MECYAPSHFLNYLKERKWGMQKRLFDNKLLSIIAVIILSLALAIGLASCGADNGKKGRDKKKVEATKEKSASGKSSDSSKADNEGESEASGSDDSSSKALEAEKAKEKEKEKKKEKAKEKERAKEEKSKKDSSDSSHSSSSHSKKKWVPAVYKTVTHPAVTRQQKFIDYYTCQCGATFKTNAEWQAHRPKP